MYRIVKDNHYEYVHNVQKRYFGFLWLPVYMGNLEACREWKTRKEIGKKGMPRYTVIE